jgi:hypothetical protein
MRGAMSIAVTWAPRWGHFPSEVSVAATYIEKPQAAHVPAQFDLGRSKELVTVTVMTCGLSLGVLIGKLIPGNTH